MSTTKRVLILSAVFVLTFALIVIIFNGILSFIGATLAGVIVCLFINKFFLSNESAAKTEPADVTAPPKRVEVEMESLIENLVRTNQKSRENGLPSNALASLEALIDLLIEALPQVNKVFPRTESAWTCNRVVTDYLPKLIAQFNNLTEAQQTVHANVFVESLASIRTSIEKILQITEAGDLAAFETEAKFISAKFNTTPERS